MKFLLKVLFLIIGFSFYQNPGIYSQGYNQNWPDKHISIELTLENNLYDFFNSIEYLKTVDGRSVLYISSVFDPLSIYKFSIIGTEGILETSILINTEGPNAIKGGVTGFKVLNEDSIFIFGDVKNYAIIDEAAQILEKFSCEFVIDANTINADPIMISGGISSYIFDDLIVSSTCGSPDFKVLNVGSIIDTKSNSCFPIMGIGDFLDGWYGIYNANAFHFFCANDQYIYGAPASSHRVHLIDKSLNKISSIEMPLSILGKLKKISSDPRKNMAPIKQEEYLAHQGFYYDLIYDKYANLFYRRAFDKNRNFKKIDDAFKHPYLLVFDEKYKKTFEVKIPNAYKSFRVFTSDYGLCILNQDLHDKNEEKMIFDCFKFEN